jgi:hypothetical protein
MLSAFTTAHASAIYLASIIVRPSISSDQISLERELLLDRHLCLAEGIA